MFQQSVTEETFPSLAIGRVSRQELSSRIILHNQRLSVENTLSWGSTFKSQENLYTKISR
jgi:hypothetical protein